MLALDKTRNMQPHDQRTMSEKGIIASSFFIVMTSNKNTMLLKLLRYQIIWQKFVQGDISPKEGIITS